MGCCFGVYKEEDLRKGLEMLKANKYPGAPPFPIVQTIEPGRVYSLPGLGGLFNNTPPNDPDFFRGKMTNETFVEAVNLLNDSGIMAMVGEPRLISMNSIPLREQKIMQALTEASQRVNELLRQRKVDCVFSFEQILDSRNTGYKINGQEVTTQVFKTPCTITFANHEIASSIVNPSEVRAAMKKLNRKYAFMVSHAKGDAAAEAVLFQESFIDLLGLRPEDGFLDSNNLRDVRECAKAAADSLVLFVLQTKNVLTRPWVLAEIYSAQEAGTIILPIVIEGKGYNFDEARNFLKSETFPEDLEAITPGACAELSQNGIKPATLGPVLATMLPYLISKPFNFAAPREVRKAMLQAIVAIFMEKIKAI